jgi:hypothetical protein
MTSARLGLASEDAAFEGDREGVECGFRAVHPALASLAGRVEAADDKIETLQRGLLVGDVPTRPRGAPEAGVLSVQEYDIADVRPVFGKEAE